MSLSITNLRRWTKMLFGKSIDHVKQGVGKSFCVGEIRGYYNDLTKKVTEDKEHYCFPGVFSYKRKGKESFPAIEVFQYGLGAFDLYLMGVDKELMKAKFIAYVDWALMHQDSKGAWDAFSFRFSDNIFSAMAQGEGASLLIRGYLLTGQQNYLIAAKKAIDFMLLSSNQGGTSASFEEGLCLLEYTNRPYVFNGWIFAYFGLYDYCLVSSDDSYLRWLDSTKRCLLSLLPRMDNGYWSMYDGGSTIASPFYHRLHISLLTVMYEITQEEEFLNYSRLFEKYNKNPFFKARAFVKKTIQKIKAQD